MKIVCGCDLSLHSDPALRAAIALAKRLPVTELWFVHILDAASASLGLSDLKLGATRMLKQRLAELPLPEELRARCDTMVATAPADARSVEQALLRFGRRHGADLIVVASQGAGASPLVRLGGTSERLAHVAELPVLVVRDAAPFEAWAREERPLRVLLGSDGSPSSRPAIELVKQLRAAGRCDVVLGRVYDAGEAARQYGLPYPAHPLTPDPRIEALIARDLAREFELPEGEPSVRCQPVLGIGRRGDHLLDLAERETVDLIVVGTQRKAWFDRLSSVSSVVLHFGHSAVACVPKSPAEPSATRALPKLRRVLAATDLSALGNEAIRHAFSLLGEAEAEVYLVHVVPAAQTTADDALLAGALREQIPRQATRGRIAARTEIIHDDQVAEAIVAAAQRLGADVICVGSHGHSGLRRTLLGSVAEAVMRHARQPVFVVRTPA